MPAPLKALIDRTMPLTSVARQNMGDFYEHVGQADFSHRRYMMIWGCGFPNSRHNFEPPWRNSCSASPCIHTTITIPISPMFYAPEAAVISGPRLAKVRRAGEQLSVRQKVFQIDKRTAQRNKFLPGTPGQVF